MLNKKTANQTQVDNAWWRDAVIYQVYVRSLCDSNGDGVGDLNGIRSRLDYFSSLGVDALWITPFFRSPMKDFGYDVSDYRDVDPLFGSLEDFDQLLSSAHQLGIRIIIDQVLSHTSDQHAWFQESRESRDNPRSDWYVWADPQADGSAPNNWLSIFGGPAWTWEPRRKQYYLHNFLDSQPDLNYHNPAVQAQILDEVEFWLKRGVDGCRLDAINFCFHDAALRDNPAKPESEREGRGFSVDNPYAHQRHLYNNTQPEMLPFLERLRGLVDQYPGVVTLGEISSEDSLATMADYTAEGRLHMAYSFELLVDDYSARHIRDTVETMEQRMGAGWPCWSVGNHDVTRVLSRWGNGQADPAQARMLNALLLSLRGGVCSYQGEELGLTEADIPLEQLQDPYGINFWPDFKGRDGCRTPIPWGDRDEHADFTCGSPWLPVAPEHRQRAVSTQEQDQASVLNAYRAMVAFRKSEPALRWGDIEFLDTAGEVLAFRRTVDGDSLLCVFNLDAAAASFELPGMVVNVTPSALGSNAPAQLSGELPGHAFLFLKEA